MARLWQIAGAVTAELQRFQAVQTLYLLVTPMLLLVPTVLAEELLEQ